jgi:predicted Zn-dependent protease
MRAGSSAVATSNGLFGYHSGTGVASTLTIRTPDGQSSGWAGDEGADWRTIESERIAEDALRKCRDWRGKTALDPGKYEVVLEPTAVGMLLSRLPPTFDARQADERPVVFSRRDGGNRVGETLFDPATIVATRPRRK